MNKLPSDTIFDILSRFPVKSLACFRSVSKPWRAYIDDDDFGILHGKRTVEELTPIMYDPYESCIIGFDIIKSEEGGNTTLKEKKGGMSLAKPKKDVSLESVLYKSCSTFVGGSCNGLLYLSLDDIPHVTSLAVIHPLRKELYELPPMQQWLDGPYYLNEESRGLGFDVSTNTFKMVCVFSRREFSKSETNSKNLCTMVHVLGMDSSWREIPQVPPYPTSGNGIFAHGCLYWFRQSNSQEEFICFDVRNEEFTLIYPPKKRCGYSISVTRYQLVDLHGEVGYAYFYNDGVNEVWVLKQKQWVKHCQFSKKPPLPRIRSIKVLGRWNKDGDILIESVKKVFVYSLKSQLVEEVNIVGKKYGRDTYMYMYPASSMFSIRGIKKTAHSIKTDLKQLGERFQLLNL